MATWMQVSAQPVIDIQLDPEKCYGRCTMVNYNQVSKTYTIIAKESSIYENLNEIIDTRILPASQKWVKKKADENCVSEDPNDCLVWCLEETPAKRVTNLVCPYSEAFINAYLANPEEFEMTLLESESLESDNSYPEWLEIPCNYDPDYPEILKKVIEALNNAGFDIKPRTTLDPSLKAILVKFQKANDLPPCGLLDEMTLETLLNPTSTIQKQHTVKTYCQYKSYGDEITTADTLEYKGYFYTGDKARKLDFADYIDLTKINANNYNPDNHRHAIVMNKNFDKLYEVSPEDFKERNNTVVYQKVIREEGEVVYECLCPSDEKLPIIQTKVESALSALGYETDGKFGKITKQSLAMYQIKNDKPIGVLEFETLDLLEVEY